ncbi:MAG: amidase [Chloroflexi bacterium]|nr:amidase [Chloroflexota bacterium]
MADAADLAYTSAAELAGRVRQRELSPVEIIDACIQRIEARNPSLNAFVYEGFEDARQRARAAEQAVMSGAELGPLHGVPTAMKDCFDFKPGWPTTFGGVRALKDWVATFSCPYVERIERAGAILLGKTNSPIMGFRGTCDNYLFGPSHNPFDLSRNTGGSSGGSAAAVADGLVPIAEGTDGGGSIRIPASWCGVFGYKASFGRVPYVSRPNAFGGDTPFLFEGTETRTVEDAALGMTALAGYHPSDPLSLDEHVDFLGALRRSVSGMRIAYSPNFDVFPVEPEVARVVASAVRTFESAGAHVEEVKLGIKRGQRELSDLWCRLIIGLNVVAFDDFKRNGLDILGEHADDLPPEFRAWLEVGDKLTLRDFLHDQAMRTEIYDAIQGALNTYDLLVTPTLACTAVKNADDGNTKGPTEIQGVGVDPLIGWCLTYPVNYSGHPAASVPAGLSDDGLPVGMQIIGRRYADVDVLTASAVFERMRPWRQTYQACAARPLDA